MNQFTIRSFFICWFFQFFSLAIYGQYQTKKPLAVLTINKPYSNGCGSSLTGNVWTNPTNAESIDGLCATTTVVTPEGQNSEYLAAENFGFSIPLTATITGVQVCVMGYSTKGGIDISANLIVGGLVTGTTQGPVAMSIAAGCANTNPWYAFGAYNNLWGSALTPANVNSSNFGVALVLSSFCCPLCAVTLSTEGINAIYVTVNYNSNNTVVSCSNVLPVELLNFNCQTAPSGIQLNWATATETNNSFFTLKRSNDGANFTAIGTVQGAGNSDTRRNYSFTDEMPENGTNYYLLEQTDYDGNSQSFPPSACNSDNLKPGSIYPNPASGSFTLILNPTVTSQTITISDMLGRTVYSNSVIPIAIEKNSVVINISSLAPGLYLVTLAGENMNPIVKKLLVR